MEYGYSLVGFVHPERFGRAKVILISIKKRPSVKRLLYPSKAKETLFTLVKGSITNF